MKENKIIDKSYQNHIAYERDNRLQNRLPSSYSNPDSIDAYRHNRMRDTILPIFNEYREATWLTMGDENFGSDCHYLQHKGADVLASSISDETISVAKELGYIEKFKKINAENITEPDYAFDFVFCKEAFHHFPRPYVALYEMIRVANLGVVLIEPQEQKARIFDFFKKMFKVYLRKDKSLDFEYSGNFIFRVNINEMAKIMTAMNYRYIAYY